MKSTKKQKIEQWDAHRLAKAKLGNIACTVITESGSKQIGIMEPRSIKVLGEGQTWTEALKSAGIT